MQKKVVRAIFDNIQSLTAQDIEGSNILKGLLKVEVPKAIEYAVENGKTFATIFEINTSNSFIELHKNQWIQALETCVIYYVEEEDYESCNKITKLMELIKNKSAKKVVSRKIKTN
jgi:sugar/nucleoside kinase (ribokinase family)